MNFKKMIAAISAAAFCMGMGSTIPEQFAAAGEPVRIMAVGDSITHGYINADNGYRKYFCHHLQQNGIDFDMVGPNNNWTNEASYNWNGTNITYDPAHAGYSGYSIMQYNGRSGIYETLFGNGNMMETYDPDIVLLQIGTNDLLDARLNPVNNSGDITAATGALDRLETLVDKILEHMDSSDVLFVSTIPDIDAAIRADWLAPYGWTYGVDTGNTAALSKVVDECVDAYNTGVAELVSQKQAAGKNVQFGDVHSCIDIAAGDLEDGCHPSEQGYAKMGAHWAEKVSAYLGSGTVNPPATEPTDPPTEPTTEPIIEHPSLKGDLNNDHSFTVTDIIALQKYLLCLAPLDDHAMNAADMDSNNKINAFDLALVKRKVLEYTPMAW